MSLLMVRKSAPTHAADKIEKIAQDSAIVAMWQVLGDAEAYLREGKKDHNVKNVLAAAIKAAEKENPNDRSVLEAKKVLAQFDAGDEVIAQKNGYKLVHNTLNDGYWFYTKSGAGWGLTATNKVAAVNEFNRLVDSAKDSAADADKSEELEREIKGDVVAVVSGNAARVSKDVSFATAKEGVESFARKNGVSVVSSQEYGEAYKFKFSAAIDCAAAGAQDAATFKVGDLVRMNEGGLTGKITKIEPNGHYRVSFLYNRANGFSQSFSANEIVMVKPAADSNEGAAQDAGAFPLAEKASRIVKGIMSQVKRVEDEAEAAFRNAKTAEEKNAAQRDAVAIHNIMDKLEIAASYA